MQSEIQKFFSVGHRRAYAKGITEGLTQGKAEGLTQGKAEGKAEGMAEGMASATAKALLTIRAQRGLLMTARQRRKVSQCTKLATLEA